MHAYMHTCKPASIHPSIHTSTHPSIHAYMLTCLHAYIHPCIHTSMHPCSHASMHPCIHPYIQTYIQTYMHTYVQKYIHTYTHRRIHTYTHTLHCIALHYITLHTHTNFPHTCMCTHKTYIQASKQPYTRSVCLWYQSPLTSVRIARNFVGIRTIWEIYIYKDRHKNYFPIKFSNSSLCTKWEVWFYLLPASPAELESGSWKTEITIGRHCVWGGERKSTELNSAQLNRVHNSPTQRRSAESNSTQLNSTKLN